VVMNKFVYVLLSLAPLQLLQAARVLEPEVCCALQAGPEILGEDNGAEDLNKLGSELYARGDYARAERVLRQGLEAEQRAEEPDRGRMASTLGNLAAAVRMESRLPEAEQLYGRAIELREAVSGPEARELSRSLAGLAMVYGSDGRVAKGVELARRAVAISAGDVEDPRSMAIANNTLATLLLTRGDAAEAGRIEQRVAEELQRTGNADTQEYINALTNLGTSSLRQLRYREAETELRGAEAAALKVVGPEHPLTAVVWNNLAKAKQGQGDGRSAEALFEKAIAAWRKALGPTHPDVAYGLTNLAALQQSRKHFAEAERLYRQAREIDEAALGAESLRVANDWNNLGALAVVTHRNRDAEEWLSRALRIAKARAGMEHPDTSGIAVNLAVLYFAQHRYEDAAALFAEALPSRERVLGRDSAELGSILRLYAGAQKASRNYVAAERAELQAMRITTHNALAAEAR